MNHRPLDARRIAGFLARAAAVGSGVMLGLTVLALSPNEVSSAGAAGTFAGPASVVTPQDGLVGSGQPLASGNSATPFSLFLGAGAACPGDSANDGYSVTSFMVPSATDLTTLQFDPITGPNPQDVGANFRQPLYLADSGSAYTGAQTANATTPPGPGPVINIPTFDLSSAGYVPGNIPAGAYKIGIACIKGAASDTQLSNFWAAEINVAVAASGGGPAEITWTTVGGGTTTTTASGGTTTTTASGGTTTSTTASGGSTTTTAAGGSTTSTTASGGSTSSTSTAAAGGTTGGVSGSGGTLPTTGSSPAALVMWAIFLVVCGRMAVVLGRPPKVRTPRA